MKVICQVDVYGYDAEKSSKLEVQSCIFNGDRVTLEFKGQKCEVNADELISAVKRCMLDCFGK